jgi:hypothetical protein
LNLAEISPRVAALTSAISAMTAPDSEAGSLYQSALTHPGIAEFPFEHARIHLAQGMWLRRARRHTEARVELELAADGFDQLGARPWAERARAELRAAGASVKQSLGETVPLRLRRLRAKHQGDCRRTQHLATHRGRPPVPAVPQAGYRQSRRTERGLEPLRLHVGNNALGFGDRSTEDQPTFFI